MPIWWVGLCGVVGLAVGYIFQLDWAKLFGMISLASAALGLLLALIRR